MKRTLLLILGVTLLAVCALAQAQDTPFQVRYAVNLDLGDSFINISNSGASSTVAFPNQNGNLCANIYTFAPDEQEISCCSCLVTPNALNSLSVKNDLISNTLTPGAEKSVVIKVLASTGTPACNASTVGTGANVLATGILVWGSTYRQITTTVTTPSPYWWQPPKVTTTTNSYVTETPFTPATLSAAELTRMTTLCGNIQTNGSGYGICRSCRQGGQ